MQTEGRQGRAEERAWANLDLRHRRIQQRKEQAKSLLDQLTFARSALLKDRNKVAVLSLRAFQVQLAGLTLRHRLEVDVALSLAFAAGALETWLEQTK